MRVLAVVHQPDAGPGVFADAVRARGAELESWLIAETDSPPAPPASYDAVLTFGGAMHADQEDRHPWLRTEKALLADLLAQGVPLLGVCLGAQLVAEAAGGRAERLRCPEIGWYEVALTDAGAGDPVLGPLGPAFCGFQWHSYGIALPAEATTLAQSPLCLQAYRIGRAAWGIQFHAEVSAPGAEAWIDDYRSDEDAVRMGLDPERLRGETRERIAAWNELGQEICDRFLATAGGDGAVTAE
jgi:GMP synthase (glutamine-hydrolysing)